MSAQVGRDPWPTSAKVILLGIGALAILVAVPWLFMWTAMASWCAATMNGMRDMMGPGMMR
jgi:hypothetical protein